MAAPPAAPRDVEYEQTVAWLAKTVIAEGNILEDDDDAQRQVNITEFSVTACAPKWVIVSTTKLKLNGKTSSSRETLSFNMQPDLLIQGGPSRLVFAAKSAYVDPNSGPFKFAKTEDNWRPQEGNCATVSISFRPNASFERIRQEFLRLQRLCGTDGAVTYAGKGSSAHDLGEPSRERATRQVQADDAAKEREAKERHVREYTEQADRTRARMGAAPESAAAIQQTIDSVNATSAAFAKARADLAAGAQGARVDRRTADAQRPQADSVATEARHREVAQAADDSSARRKAEQEAALGAAASEKKSKLTACLARPGPSRRTAQTNPFIADRQGFESLLASAQRCVAQPWAACLFSPHTGALWAIEGRADTDHSELFRRFNAPGIHISGSADVCLDQPVRGTRGDCETDVSNERFVCIARLKKDIDQMKCDWGMLPKVWAAEDSLRDADAKTKQDDACHQRFGD